jgi:hypothetical protein
VTQSQRAMRKHVKRCWGDDVVLAADKAANTNDVHSTTIKGPLNPQSITAAFESKGKGKVMYSHKQHTKTEARYGGGDCDDEAEKELCELAEGLDVEEATAQSERDNGEDDGEDDNGDDRFRDEMASLSAVDRKALDESLWPMRSLLVKVSNPSVTWAY